MQKVLIFLTILLAIVSSANSLRCYGCNNKDHSNCMDTFSGSEDETIKGKTDDVCQACRKFKFIDRKGNTISVNRTCWSEPTQLVPTQCSTTSFGDTQTTEECFCNTEFCNSAGRALANCKLGFVIGSIFIVRNCLMGML